MIHIYNEPCTKSTVHMLAQAPGITITMHVQNVYTLSSVASINRVIVVYGFRDPARFATTPFTITL